MDCTPQRVPRSKAEPISGVRLEAPRRRRATSLGGLDARKDADCSMASPCDVPRSPPRSPRSLSPSTHERAPPREETERLLVTCGAGEGAVEFAWGGEVYRVKDISAFERVVSPAARSQAAGSAAGSRKRSLADLRRAQRLAWEAKSGAPAPEAQEPVQAAGKADPAVKRAWQAAMS
mmetsp:Transcript_48979/g.113905  ORF Transcript_48979/g.113905 Transcript_48979/m.113905 type:complete len:177 (+) Transcript_48979:113-643(+)